MTTLPIDEELVDEIVVAGGYATRQEAVAAALKEYLRAMHRRLALVAMESGPAEDLGDPPRRERFDHDLLLRVPNDRT